MNRQVIIGFATEGSTDVRFLESIIQRTFEDVAFECTGQVEVLPVQFVPKANGSFPALVKQYALYADQLGVMVLCIHNDADAYDDTQVFQNKIEPAFRFVQSSTDVNCKNLVAIVPVRMTEAWMLADKTLLKEEIGTDKSDAELQLQRLPESIADPKQTIIDAIRIARQGLTQRRRRDLTIGELYQPIGQKIVLDQLEILPSYSKFRRAVQDAFRQMNYLP